MSRWSFGRYLYLLVSITAIGLLALFAVQFHDRLESTRRTADATTRNLALHIASHIRITLEDHYRVAALIARRVVTDRMDQQRCNTFLAEMLGVFPDFFNLVVFGADGRLICSGRPLQIPPDKLQKNPAYEQALQGRRAPGELAIDRGRWTLVATEPLPGTPTGVGGVVTMLIDLSTLDPLAHTVTDMAESLVTLTDNNGIVLARSDKDNQWTGQPAGDILPDAALFSPPHAPVIRSGLDGVRRIYGFALVPEYGWRVYAGIPEEALLAKVRHETRFGMGLAAAIIVFILLLAMTLARRVTAPVHAMATALGKHLYGASAPPIPEQGPAELASLARTFNAAIAARSQAEVRFTGVINSAMDAIVTINERSEIVLLNPSAEKMFGYSAAELAGQPVSVLMPRRFHEGHDRHIAAFSKTGITSRVMGRLGQIMGRRRNGEEFPIEASISQLGTSPDKLFTAILRDITERQQTEQRIRQLNRVYAVLSGINTLIVRTRDRQHLLDEACRIAIDKGGFGIAWISELNPEGTAIRPVAWGGLDTDWFNRHPDAGTYFGQGLIRQAIEGKHAIVSNNLSTETSTGGTIRAEAISRGYHSLIVLPLVVDDKATGTLSLYAKETGFFTAEEIRLLDELASDVSFAMQYLAREQRASYLTYYDAVTGLPNRTLFLERVSLALRSAQPSDGHFVLALGDIRRYRMINETLGRSAGDTVLKLVAERLLKLVRNPENLARAAGDVFAVFLPAIHDLTELPHRIDALASEALHNPVTINGQPLSLAFTVGAAVFPQDGADAETLFRNAEAALKKAKAGGEKYLFYAPEMNARVAESLLMENKLRRALELQQFVLYYQPKVDVRTRAVTGLEALIRWRDPELGLVPPIRFISLLEECGLILEVGRWALEQAVRDYRQWTSAGLKVPRIAVNLSAIQLRHKGFIDTIVSVVDGFGELDVAIDLEITESVVMENVQEMVKKLQIVRGLGVEIAIDDFGTGYSSLSYIAKLPINTLKIDRAFIIAMTESEYSLNIVTMIIQLAHTLHLKVVAEGVDDEKHVQILSRLNCDQMQGYLISKPVPPEEVPAILGTAIGDAGV